MVRSSHLDSTARTESHSSLECLPKDEPAEATTSPSSPFVFMMGTEEGVGHQETKDYNKESRDSWDDLMKIERSRREILTKVELPFWKILMNTTGTCFHAFHTESMIWIPLFIYVGIRLRIHLGSNDIFEDGDDDNKNPLESLGDTDLQILGGFLSFLLVLFVNQTNSRFWDMYMLARACAGRIQDIAGYAVTLRLPPAMARTLVCHANAAHLAGYVGLPHKTYNKHNFFDILNADYKLLTPRELARIELLDMDSGARAFKELITWCQRDVARALRAGYIDTIESTELHSRILAFRASMDGIHDYSDQPPLFYYIHFLCLLTALYLPLFAVDNAYSVGSREESKWTMEVINGTIVFLQSVFVVGLRLLGQKMIQPMGDDLEDLSVIEYVVNAAIGNSNYIMATTQPGDDEVEVQA